MQRSGLVRLSGVADCTRRGGGAEGGGERSLSLTQSETPDHVTPGSETAPWRWAFRTAAQVWDCPEFRLESAGFESKAEATAELAVVRMGRGNSILSLSAACRCAPFTTPLHGDAVIQPDLSLRPPRSARPPVRSVAGVERGRGPLWGGRGVGGRGDEGPVLLVHGLPDVQSAPVCASRSVVCTW